jgi:hypothetical protein
MSGLFQVKMSAWSIFENICFKYIQAGIHVGGEIYFVLALIGVAVCNGFAFL